MMSLRDGIHFFSSGAVNTYANANLDLASYNWHGVFDKREIITGYDGGTVSSLLNFTDVEFALG